MLSVRKAAPQSAGSDADTCLLCHAEAQQNLGRLLPWSDTGPVSRCSRAHTKAGLAAPDRRSPHIRQSRVSERDTQVTIGTAQ